MVSARFAGNFGSPMNNYLRLRELSPDCPPPIKARSISFRLSFRAVRLVRSVNVGGAEQRGCIWTGLPGASTGVWSRRFSVLLGAQVHLR